MKKILIITLITFILLLGQTYSKQEENINEQIFLIKLSNITNKNISLLDECLDKIITIYPENNYNTMKSYIFNYESIKNNTKNFEKQYLKEIYKISESLSEFKSINATVIQRNSSYWMESMTINKGKKDGVDIGMSVVVGEGLVGKVTNITNNTSTIKLITSTDNNNKVSIIRYPII